MNGRVLCKLRQVHAHRAWLPNSTRLPLQESPSSPHHVAAQPPSAKESPASIHSAINASLRTTWRVRSALPAPAGWWHLYRGCPRLYVLHVPIGNRHGSSATQCTTHQITPGPRQLHSHLRCSSSFSTYLHPIPSYLSTPCRQRHLPGHGATIISINQGLSHHLP